jgi:hypothetical protein
MFKVATKKRLELACVRFNRENFPIEQALAELFSRYPENTNENAVLLKVVALNALYSTQIPTYSQTIPSVIDVAHHIHRKGSKIDPALAAGSPEIVDTIANISVPGKKTRCNFSFATKYCSWHRPDSYPIWDSRVDGYLQAFEDHGGFSTCFENYPTFLKVMTAFRKHHRLECFSFKDIDKFLWLHGQ